MSRGPDPGSSVFANACQVLLDGDPRRKCEGAAALWRAWRAGALTLHADEPPRVLSAPGRPDRPHLVSPRELPQRKRLRTAEGRAVLLHALAHIEFNAVNLALDAVYRFRGMPRDYYGDWLRVASEEAHHFALLGEHLRQTGFDYGDFPAHDGLWQMAVDTAHDPLLRMALVPRVLEARGLDVTPGLIERLRAAGDERAAEILGIIRRDEIGHVAIGSHWFGVLCRERGLEPGPTFFALVDRHLKGRLKGPFNVEDRARAGFSPEELARLQSLD